MASSILTGDRRWASTRKSGMTVLGKVPKPINLPSQRLENNGLDPNVEIVPKGTLTWGNRPSLATPNAWSSSTLLSPKTDGSIGSPSCINGRPSSGSSGSRPSTAGSDRSHEPASNAWGPNSRPSSASGLLAANQTSIVATRPRSAETRPVSSQLSRFAENSAESTVAWGSTRTVGRLGAPSSKTNGFTLSSGDFPTLGSEKNSESHNQRGHSSQGCPASASGTDEVRRERLESPLSGDAKVAACSDQGTMNAQKAGNYMCVGGGAPPNMNWQMEPQHAGQYPSLNMTPHQFDSWRGPSIHSVDGIWYRGGGLGGPCRPTGSPGGFTANQFNYYPQFPPNSEAAPRQGAGQGGYHPSNDETYRPHVPPNSFMVVNHPVLPARPGVYQAPVPYDGYHGMPQAGFCSYSEQEVPFLGVASQPGVYNPHPHQNGNLNPGLLHMRPGGHDPPMATETDRPHGTHQGQYKVLLKQHDSLEDDKLQEMGQPVVSNPPQFDKGRKPGGSAQDESWCTNSRKDEQAVLGRSKTDCEGFSKPSSDFEGHSSDPVIMDSQENSDKATDGILMRPETAVSVAHDRQGYHPVTKNNATLIEKIGGLNNKARSADGHSEVTPFSFREEKTKLKAATRKEDYSSKTMCSNVIPMDNGPSSGMVVPASGELSSSTMNNDPKSSSDWKAVPGLSESQVIAVGESGSSELGEVGYSHNYRRDHALRARVDYHAKSRSNRQVDDRRTKESLPRDSSVTITVTNGEDGPQVGVPDGHSSQEAAAKELHHAINSASCTFSLDSLDYRTQRAKMKEIAAQRAKQLQEAEEERTKEQKAKALAKLEELNRRSSAQSPKQNSNDAIPTSIDMQHKQDSGTDTVLKTDATNNKVRCVMLAENSDVLIQANDSKPKNLHAPAELPSDIASDTSNHFTQDPAISHDPSLALRQETNSTVVASQKLCSHIHDTSISKHKHMGYRRRHNISMEKNLGEKAVASGNMESPKNLVEMVLHPSIGDSLPYNEDPSVQHKKKNTKNSRNKNKLDEAPMSSTTPSLAHTEIEKGPIVCQETHPPASVVETVSVPAQNSSEISGAQGSRDVMVTSSKQEWSKATEEARARTSNQLKPQPPRRSARTQQGIKPGDKFHGSEAVVWAPVKQQNKNEQQPEEISQSNITDACSQSLEKKEHDIQNGMKTKRAEMERYVPKPVAKEMYQQENSRQPSFLKQGASSDKSGKPEFDYRSIDGGRPDGLAVGKMEFLADTKNGEENKPNRRGRTNASWRQRNSAESASVFQSSGEGSGSSGAKVVQNTSDQHQLLKPDSQVEKQFKSDDWDSNNDNAVPTELISAVAGVKDEGITGRHKRQQFKAHRVAGNNNVPAGNKDLQTGIDNKVDIQIPAPDLKEPDLRNASKTEDKNSGGEHMRSHWKPKSHINTHKQGNRGNGGQGVAFHSGRSNKESASKGFESNPLQEDINALIQKNGVGKSHQEAEGYMKVTVDPSKQQTHTPNQDVLTNAELGPENGKAQHEHQVIPVPRRHGQHNGRFNRDQEAAYRGRDSDQDAGRQNFHKNGDRRKTNSHYEYQPIGPCGKPSDSSQWNSHVGEEAREGSQAPGLRYRERDQNRSRHGGQFFRRSSVAHTAVFVGEPYNNGD